MSGAPSSLHNNKCDLGNEISQYNGKMEKNATYWREEELKTAISCVAFQLKFTSQLNPAHLLLLLFGQTTSFFRQLLHLCPSHVKIPSFVQ